MRKESDFYPTPNWCFETLPINFNNYKTALEPCKGDGRIVSFLENKDITVDWCEIREGLDFLEPDFDFGLYDLILTNPPFSLALEFIKKSLEISDTVILLLRLNFLGAQCRKEFWQNNEPDTLYILSKRPSFTGKGTDSTEYAWFVWDKTNKIEKGIFHI